MWHSFYNNEPKVLLKRCQSRWLSLLRCIRRYLDLLDGLLSYFGSCDEQTAKVVSITERLENPLPKPILHFLNHVLPSMDRFNRSFQKSNTQRVSCIQIFRYTKIYAFNFLTEEAVCKAGDKIHLADMDKVKLEEDLSIGDETWLCISALEEEKDTKPFFYVSKLSTQLLFGKCLRNFHLATQFSKIWVLSNKRRQNLTLFPPLRDLPRGFLRLRYILQYSFIFLPRNSQIFLFLLKLLGITKIVMEWRNHVLGLFGGKLVRKTLLGELRFANLEKLMAGLLAIPSSNADSQSMGFQT